MDPNRQTPAQPEKEHYSYDEMMERLRGQRSSGASRRIKIESSDGSVEIKKRRRRSHQPIKERRQRVSKLKRNALLTVIPLILLLIGIYLLINVRYQSDSFRSSISQRASKSIGAPTDLAPLNIKGLNVRSRRMFIEPEPPALLQAAEFISLHGRLTAGSLFASDWHLTSLDALHGKLSFHAPSLSSARLDQAAGQGGSHGSLVSAGLGFSSNPGAFNIDQINVGSTDFVWTNGLKETVFLEDATLSSNRIDSRTEMQVSDATLRFGDWPEFELDNAKVSFTRDEIRVEDALLKHSLLGGEAVLAGTVDLSGGAPLADFICELVEIPATSLVRAEWKGKLEGDISADLNFKADLSKPGSLVVSGEFYIRGGSFGDINPTKRLAVFLTEPNISRVKFHSIKGKITIAEGRQLVEDLEAVAPSLLRVTGGYQIENDGTLKGSIDLSISNKILEAFPGGVPACFTMIDDNWSSTPVELSGTTSDPTEDLTERLQQALEKHERESAAPPASSYPTIPLAPEAKRSKKSPRGE